MRLLLSLVRIYAAIVIVWAMLLVGFGGGIGPTELFLMMVIGLGVGLVLTRRVVRRARDARVSHVA